MGNVARRSGWVEDMIDLTVHPEDRPTDRLVDAQARVARLAVAARALAAAPQTPAVSAAFDRVPGADRARELVPVLAGLLPLAGAPAGARSGTAATTGATGAETLVADYLDALRRCCGAVYYCRRVQHVVGTCWFSIRGPEDDVCGRVLAAAHGLGDCG